MTPRAAAPRAPSRQSQVGLDGLNFFLADIQTGVGPFLAVYLAANAWNEEGVGLALTVGGVAGIAMQAPAGWLVDRLPITRTLVAVGVVVLALGALLMAFVPSRGAVLVAQLLLGGVSSIFTPAICAMSLGLVGHGRFDERQGRNQAFNAAGNVVAAVAMGLLGYFVSNRSIFFLVVAVVGPTLFAVHLVRPDEIDRELSRGGTRDAPESHGEPGGAVPLRALFRERPLRIFLVCAVMFHFANAAMLPLLGELLARGGGRRSMAFMSACVVTTQLVVMLIASWAGRQAGAWGRKPLLLIAFGVLPVRGFLYTVTAAAPWLVAIQILDGVGAGIFTVVSVLVIADLTRGTGRFNVTLGVVSAAVSLGASFSQLAAGSLVKHLGFRVGFLSLASLALAGFLFLLRFMPETGEARAGQTAHGGLPPA